MAHLYPAAHSHYKQKYGRERGPEDTIGHIVGGVFSEVGHTMREIAHNKTVLVYMMRSSSISMASHGHFHGYQLRLGFGHRFDPAGTGAARYAVRGLPSAIIYGKLAGRVGTLNMILVAVAAYMGIVLFAAFFLKTAFEFGCLHYGRPVPGRRAGAQP
ncbi:MAG: hypothetical protein ACLU0O_07345 [Collinsella sp.]